MIREQAKNLRMTAKLQKSFLPSEVYKMMLKAANTIEELYKRVQGGILCKNRLPEISEEDLLLLVKDENNEYHYEIGYYQGKENNELMFDNCYHGWVQGEVISWKHLPKMQRR